MTAYQLVLFKFTVYEGIITKFSPTFQLLYIFKMPRIFVSSPLTLHNVTFEVSGFTIVLQF